MSNLQYVPLVLHKSFVSTIGAKPELANNRASQTSHKFHKPTTKKHKLHRSKYSHKCKIRKNHRLRECRHAQLSSILSLFSALLPPSPSFLFFCGRYNTNMKFLILALLAATANARLHEDDANHRDLGGLKFRWCKEPCLTSPEGFLVCQHDDEGNDTCWDFPWSTYQCYPGTSPCINIPFIPIILAGKCEEPCNSLTPFPTGTPVCKHEHDGTCWPNTHGCVPGSEDCIAVNDY